MIHLKKGVRLTPEMAMTVILINANEIFTKHGACVITSGIEGAHSENSRHYSFMALDFRANHITKKARAAVIKELRKAMGADFDVIPSNAGAIHVEYDPKGPINK